MNPFQAPQWNPNGVIQNGTLLTPGRLTEMQQEQARQRQMQQAPNQFSGGQIRPSAPAMPPAPGASKIGLMDMFKGPQNMPSDYNESQDALKRGKWASYFEDKLANHTPNGGNYYDGMAHDLSALKLMAQRYPEHRQDLYDIFTKMQKNYLDQGLNADRFNTAVANNNQRNKENRYLAPDTTNEWQRGSQWVPPAQRM